MDVVFARKRLVYLANSGNLKPLSFVSTLHAYILQKCLAGSLHLPVQVSVRSQQDLCGIFSEFSISVSHHYHYVFLGCFGKSGKYEGLLAADR